MLPTGSPAPLTRFIGRDREIQELLDLLKRSRLVTITGAGGTGKTRIAAEVARRIETTAPNAVHWVELGPLGSAELLTQHVAASLQSREQPDQPVFEALVASLGPPARLLVLDNCEHIVAECATLVGQLLRHCPHLTILATSREALGIAGEHAWLLRGLSLEQPPASGVVTPANEAAEFFVDRALTVNRTFRRTPANAVAIDQICRRLDGIPLAIELAASRVAVLTPTEIADRLDDVFRLLPGGDRTALPRHRTLRATVDWSYRLIAPEEQELLHRLSVFSGTFSLDAVEQVCSGDALPADRVLDVLAGLVTRSLVSMHEDAATARYGLLEIIRQYAAERLADDPLSARAQHRRHAEYFASMAESALAHLERTHSAEWIEKLNGDYDNLRAALKWAFENAEHSIGHRLVGALWWYWAQIWHLSEMQLWFEQALRAPGTADSREWGQVLNNAGSLAYMRGDMVRARELLEQSVTVLNRSGDRFREVMALGTLTNLLHSAGDHAVALESGERAAAVARTLSDPWPLCHAMSNGLGYVHTRLGNHELAETCLREAFDKMQRAGGHGWGMVEVARARAALAIDSNRLDDARRHTLDALAAAGAIQRPHSAFRVLVVAERLMCAFGTFDAAARLHGLLMQARKTGLMPFPDDARLQAESTAMLLASLGETTAQKAHGTHPESLSAAISQVSAELAARHVEHVASVSRTTPANANSNENRVHMLGRIEVIASGSLVGADIWRQTRLIELLAYLLFHPEGRTREQAGVALWPEGSSAQVKNNFHVLLHKLRRQLGRADAVIVVADKYRLNPELRIWFDAAIFNAEVTKALRESRRPDWRPLAASLALYRGDLLEGLEIGDWAREEQDRLRDLHVNGLSALADRQMEAGDTAVAISTLQELTRSDPQREDASRRLMKQLIAGGDTDAARTHYRWLVTRLRDEFDVEPEPATAALGLSLAQKA